MKIYYINKNTTKCLLNTDNFFEYDLNSMKDMRLYSISFLPYIRLFKGDTQLTLLFMFVFIMAVVAAVQNVVNIKSKSDKMKEELDAYNFMKRYQEMIDDKYCSYTNANTEKINSDY